MDDVDRMVGEIIREKRKLLKWTQVDLAKGILNDLHKHL